MENQKISSQVNDNRKPLSDKEIVEKYKSGDVPENFNPDIHTETIDLPSKGYNLYPDDHPLLSGQITLKMPTAKEEDILTSQNLLKKGTALDIFIDALIVDKRISMKDILLGDKNAILMASRILAYGPIYKAEAVCPSCGYKNKMSIDLAELETKEINMDDIKKIDTNLFEFVLPKSKKVIKYKLLTHEDENRIKELVKNNKRNSFSKASSDITARLRASIVSIDGETNTSIIKGIVENMLSMDSKELRYNMTKATPDIDLKFNFICDECDHEERMIMPFGIEFFWPQDK